MAKTKLLIPKTPTLAAVPTSRVRTRTTGPRTKAPSARPTRPARGLTVIEQTKLAFQRKHALALSLALLVGGGPPTAGYCAAHYWVHLPDRLAGAALHWDASAWVGAGVMLGALLFSAKTVWQWLQAAFQDRLKATAVVLLAEPALVAAPANLAGLSWACLGCLLAVNVIASACNLARERQLSRCGR